MLLLLVPFFLLQVLLILVFWFGHWQPLTNRLTSAVVNELDLLVTAFEGQQFNLVVQDGDAGSADLFVNLSALQNLGIRAASVRGAVDMGLDRPLRRSTLDRQLRRRLQALFPQRQIAIDIVSRPNVALIFIEQQMQDDQGARHYFFTVARARLFSDVGLNFLYLMLVLGSLIVVPSLVFLRNQVRPIRRLARDAIAFGRGETITESRIRGAREVQQAASAFHDMRLRIRRAVEQRTNMLSGVSHDLRTPLTRLKLQLALMDAGDDKAAMEADLLEMENMLEGYLDYARTNVAEDAHLLILSDLVRNAAEPQKWPGLSIQLEHLDDAAIRGRPIALLRLLNNLLANAQRHATTVWIGIERNSKHLILSLWDDGPGIAEADRERVLQPFQRLDEGRNLDEAGVGLGLTVCQDIARDHGGRLSLGNSPHATTHKDGETQAGLMVQLILPL